MQILNATILILFLYLHPAQAYIEGQAALACAKLCLSSQIRLCDCLTAACREVISWRHMMQCTMQDC